MPPPKVPTTPPRGGASGSSSSSAQKRPAGSQKQPSVGPSKRAREEKRPLLDAQGAVGAQRKNTDAAGLSAICDDFGEFSDNLAGVGPVPEPASSSGDSPHVWMVQLPAWGDPPLAARSVGQTHLIRLPKGLPGGEFLVAALRGSGRFSFDPAAPVVVGDEGGDLLADGDGGAVPAAAAGAAPVSSFAQRAERVRALARRQLRNFHAIDRKELAKFVYGKLLTTREGRRSLKLMAANPANFQSDLQPYANWVKRERGRVLAEKRERAQERRAAQQRRGGRGGKAQGSGSSAAAQSHRGGSGEAQRPAEQQQRGVGVGAAAQQQRGAGVGASAGPQRKEPPLQGCAFGTGFGVTPDGTPGFGGTPVGWTSPVFGSSIPPLKGDDHAGMSDPGVIPESYGYEMSSGCMAAGSISGEDAGGFASLYGGAPPPVMYDADATPGVCESGAEDAEGLTPYMADLLGLTPSGGIMDVVTRGRADHIAPQKAQGFSKTFRNEKPHVSSQCLIHIRGARCITHKHGARLIESS